MPKGKHPKAGRAQNFEPRYGKKTSYQDAKRRPGQSSAGKPGSKSPNHRGYRPAETDAPAKKARWTARERAGRDEARGIRGRAESGRRETPHHRADRAPASERPRYSDARRDERHTDTRPARDGRPRRDDRSRYDSDRSERSPRFDSRAGARPQGERGGRDDRPRRDNDRPAREDRARYSDAPRRNDRPRFESDRPSRDDRSRYDSDRSAREDRPRYRDDRGRDDRSARDDRPRRDVDRRRYDTDRTARDFDRPRYNADRLRYNDRDDRTTRAPRPSRDNWAPQAPAAPVEDVVHERLQASAVIAAEVENVTFADLGLGSNIVETLRSLGAETPFPIQAATIPAVLAGRDVLGRGRTGSGKTIAFGAPLVESVLQAQRGQRREFGRAPRAIILAPTRELALQIDRTVQPIARSVGLFTTQIYGGVPQGRQVGALQKGVDIVIGTPGRIEDLIEQGKLDLSEVRTIVLDEADHMCELGFVEPVQRIIRKTAEGSQKLLFSATLDREVAALVEEFLVDPAVYEVAGETQASGTIDHRVLVIDHRDKAEVLASLADREGKTLVFSRTRAYAEMLAEQFEDAGIRAVALHGDLNQAKRTRNLERLTSGRVSVLVATDVAARGIHVDDIDLVIQADAPDEYKTYLHRSGRTGRAGREGRVVTLIPRQRRRRMTELLERAEIVAPFEDVRPGDDLLEELAGRQVAEPAGTRG